MQVLVTGASGFVGSHLAEGLLQVGHDVRCLLRPTSNPQFIAHLPVEIVRAALDDADGLRDACRGTDAVFHLAGATRAATTAVFDRVNRGGTEAILEACRHSQPTVRRFIFVSSLAATGPGDCAQPPAA